MESPILELDGATLFRGETAALTDLRFTIRAGEHVAILGANGAGKSSLIRMLTRQDYPAPRPDGSSPLRILGRDRWEITELRAHLGIVSADLHHAFTDGHGCSRITGLDVALSGFFASLGIFEHQRIEPAMRDHAYKALKLAGAEHLADKPMDRLSSGEARRVLIARALAPDPEALILDEPTTGLDLPSRHHFLQMVRGLAGRGKTLILVTHHVEEIIPEIDRLILLKQGRVFADGPKSELLTSKHVSELFDLPVQVTRHGEAYSAHCGDQCRA